MFRINILFICITTALLASCVWPTPKPGEPIPTLITTTQWSAQEQTVTITVEASHITPHTVRLYKNGLLGGAVQEGTSAPFTFTLDATEFSPGEVEVIVMAFNDSTIVVEKKPIPIYGCNGFHALCDRSYAQVRYATTHNAMSNSTDGWIGPNQTFDVPAQLAAGVRGLMLDTYRADATNLLGQPQIPDATPGSTWLCHSVCALGKQPLAEGLTEIATFLGENPGEVITIILESYLSHAEEAQAFEAAGLTEHAYAHDGTQWPTLGELIDSGKRLVVLKDRSTNPLYPWQMNVWSHAFETHFSAASAEDFSCAVNRGNSANALFIFNHFLTEIFGSAELATQVNFNPLLRNRIEECESFHGTIANFITVDHVSIGDTLQNIEALNNVGAF
ncbi:MAG: Ig-like domain-containing protein [Halioglobus sp.]